MTSIVSQNYLLCRRGLSYVQNITLDTRNALAEEENGDESDTTEGSGSHGTAEGEKVKVSLLMRGVG